MSTFWNFTRDDDTGNGTIQLDGEIVTENDWWSSGGQVVALDRSLVMTMFVGQFYFLTVHGAEGAHAGKGDCEGDRHRGKRSFAGGDGRG